MVIDMKKSQAGNSILPNTFQHPNIFVDRLMFYLTPEENAVLTFAVRRILGFQENISSRKDNISLSQFTSEIRSTKDGSVLSRGCGLGISAVREALDILLHCNILLPTTTKPDPRKGQEYWLQDDENNIDWDWLEKRKSERHESGLKRTEKARCVVRQKASVGQNTTVEQQARESVPQQARGLSDNNTKPTETHGNPPLGGLSEKDLADANAQVTAMIANARKVTYRNRNQLPEIYLPFGDLYFELTKQEPTKSDLMDWMSTFEEWKQKGLQPEHIRAAFAHASRDGGFPVGRPGSLTNTAVGMKTKMLSTPTPHVDETAVETTKQIVNEKFSGEFVPRPADVPAPAIIKQKLQQLSQQKGIRK